MTRLQFRVLYREFLFRMVDLELLSAQSDMRRLLGQFAALLIFFSLWLSLGALGSANAGSAWSMQHFLISTTMLVVGLFAVLSWDSTFLDRRDVLILAPLPIPARTLFLAKVAASATALTFTVAALHSFTGLTWPFTVVPPNSGLLAPLRSLAAYWLSMLAAGAFIFCCVLGLQGLTAQLLSRRLFLRVSALLQVGAFCLFTTVYFLEPSLATPHTLAFLPSYWFVGLYQQLNGSFDPAFGSLAARAWLSLLMAICGTAVAYLLSYFRTLRQIAEAPDIAPAPSSLRWLPPFGNSFETAVVQFGIRTLLRSRRHRILLAFYWGLGFAFVILSVHQQPGSALPLASVIMLCAATFGTRVVFSLPLELGAHWIFRIAPLKAGLGCLIANRRLLYVLAVAPVWIATAVLLLRTSPWQQAAAHLTALALLAVILVELCLYNFQKIPFTCSYLPGKSHVHMAVLAFLSLLFVLERAVELERQALQQARSFATLLLLLITAAALARRRTNASAQSAEAMLHFEEVPDPAVLSLGLHRDGILPL